MTVLAVSPASAVSLLARMVTIWAKGLKKAEGVAGLTWNFSAMRLAASSLSIQMPEGSTPGVVARLRIVNHYLDSCA